MFKNFYRGKKVLVTGHTGFKGSWLCHWLSRLGAEVEGYAFEPERGAILFDQLKLRDRINHHPGDIQDSEELSAFISKSSPDVVLHLAAQSLVRRSFDQPVLTYGTNVMGTVNLLEAIKQHDRPCAVVVVTTDKCYENREWEFAYREEDPLGGYDPYSSSKACTEIVTSAYRQSFFSEGSSIKVASARAGNVIGGGDWADDRIVPDAIRALKSKIPIRVRNPISTRPWQHVLEPLSGYLQLAAAVSGHSVPPGGPQTFCEPYNFGPSLESNCSVAQLIETVLRHWDGSWVDESDPNAHHEASRLNLAVDKAFHALSWKPVWDFDACIHHTVEWYRHAEEGSDPLELTDTQISEYETEASNKGVYWAA